MTAADRVRAAVELLETDAVEVLAVIAERMVSGQRVYGRLDLARDTRDWHREVLEEVADAAVYAACGIVQRRMRR